MTETRRHLKNVVIFLTNNFILKQKEIRINYMEEISIKSDTKKIKDSQISKIIITLYYCRLFANSLSMITQFL